MESKPDATAQVQSNRECLLWENSTFPSVTVGREPWWAPVTKQFWKTPHQQSLLFWDWTPKKSAWHWILPLGCAADLLKNVIRIQNWQLLTSKLCTAQVPSFMIMCLMWNKILGFRLLFFRIWRRICKGPQNQSSQRKNLIDLHFCLHNLRNRAWKHENIWDGGEGEKYPKKEKRA